MTVLEQRFMELVPRALANIQESNDGVKESIDALTKAIVELTQVIKSK